MVGLLFKAVFYFLTWPYWLIRAVSTLHYKSGKEKPIWYGQGDWPGECQCDVDSGDFPNGLNPDGSRQR